MRSLAELLRRAHPFSPKDVFFPEPIFVPTFVVYVTMTGLCLSLIYYCQPLVVNPANLIYRSVSGNYWTKYVWSSPLSFFGTVSPKLPISMPTRRMRAGLRVNSRVYKKHGWISINFILFPPKRPISRRPKYTMHVYGRKIGFYEYAWEWEDTFGYRTDWWDMWKNNRAEKTKEKIINCHVILALAVH